MTGSVGFILRILATIIDLLASIEQRGPSGVCAEIITVEKDRAVNPARRRPPVIAVPY